ncbi:MAG: hypothetical protein IPK59_00860 [Rhodospirillaceae bacterium]|nr:hypothetical protein [Rhodospirillaceae bacterium]
MVNPLADEPATNAMIRLRQIGLATAGLGVTIADCLPILRPDLDPQPVPVAVAWLALAFPLLVPASIIDRLPAFHSIARRDLLVGPAIIMALVLFPALTAFGWIGIGFAAVATAIALVDHIVACIDRCGIDLLWLWIPVILLAGLAVAHFGAQPAMEAAFGAWVDVLKVPDGGASDARIIMLVVALPFLVACLAMAGTLIGGTLREHSTTSIVVLLMALFLAVTLPSLGLGPSSLVNGTMLLAAAVLALGIAPLFVLAADPSAEPPVPEGVIWGFALALVLILSALDSAVGLTWAVVLLAWINRHYGVKARFFQVMLGASLVIWAVIETLMGGWQMIADASPLNMAFVATLWVEGRTSLLVGSHVIVISTLMLTAIGFQRGAVDVRKYAILTLLVALVAIDLLVLLVGFAEAQALRFLAAAGWLAMPFLLAEMLALLPAGPIVYLFGKRSFTRG